MATRAGRSDSVDPAGEFPVEPALYFLHLSLVLTKRREARLEETLRAMNLTVAGYGVLRVVDRFGWATMGELADYTLTDRTTLTRVVDELVRSSLLDRSTPPHDRRQVRLQLTDSGRRAFQRAAERVVRSMRELMRDLPAEEVRAAARLLKRVVTRVCDNEQQAERLLWQTRAPGLWNGKAPADAAAQPSPPAAGRVR